VNRIDQIFDTLKRQGKKALIPFITAGDAGLDTTEKLILAMEQAGADLIELGIPFSDPIAEDPAIQEASVRALENGTRLLDIFQMVRELRKKTQIPLVMMMYLNSIFGFGKERFFALCQETGVDAVIVPDMPYEEKDEIQGIADSHNVYSISMVVPASRERIAVIAKESQGFLYCVASTSVTCVDSHRTIDFKEFFGEIKRYAEVPCAVDFEISDPQQMAEIKQYGDGVIVSSAIVKTVGQYGKQSPEPVKAFVSSLRCILDEE
jgi:tryptophan synthase alpha chain